jgi:hypothetical protein
MRAESRKEEKKDRAEKEGEKGEGRSARKRKISAEN